MILNRNSDLFLEDRGVTQCGVTLYEKIININVRNRGSSHELYSSAPSRYGFLSPVMTQYYGCLFVTHSTTMNVSIPKSRSLCYLKHYMLRLPLSVIPQGISISNSRAIEPMELEICGMTSLYHLEFRDVGVVMTIVWGQFCTSLSNPLCSNSTQSYSCCSNI